MIQPEAHLWTENVSGPHKHRKFMFIDERLSQDTEVVIAAVKQNADVLGRYARGELRFDKEIIKIAEQSAQERSRQKERPRIKEETLKHELREEIKKSREREGRKGGMKEEVRGAMRPASPSLPSPLPQKCPQVL